MIRVKFAGHQQIRFLNQIMGQTGLGSEDAAKICNVCGRTFRDWRRGKYTMSYDALSKLSKVSKMPIPENIEILPEFWSIDKASRLGGKRYFELYGAPGTIESRRKGGINSSKKFMLNPEWARRKGFVVRKEIKYPRKSSLLAEFIGIMIGDGGVRNRYQITISYNWKQDKKYANYIQKLIKNLFGISSARYIREELGSADIVVTGRNLIEFLEKIGIEKGDKIINQIDVPDWIFERKQYQIACLKGLFDTDGCVYPHKYKVDGKWYSFTKIVFTSYSRPLCKTIFQILKGLNFSPRLYGNRVYLYKRAEVDRYFKEIGTHNPRYLERYKIFSIT